MNVGETSFMFTSGGQSTLPKGKVSKGKQDSNNSSFNNKNYYY